nr:hypothetical protein [Kluyvera intermedia]
MDIDLIEANEAFAAQFLVRFGSGPGKSQRQRRRSGDRYDYRTLLSRSR